MTTRFPYTTPCSADTSPSKATCTYSSLFDGGVAMTGEQAPNNGLKPFIIARQIAAECVARLDVLTDDPDKYPSGDLWPNGTRIHHREDLDEVQRELRETPGVTVLIYDQTCADEKPRRRQRGPVEAPNRRVFLNQAVRWDCSYCGVQYTDSAPRAVGKKKVSQCQY